MWKFFYAVFKSEPAYAFCWGQKFQPDREWCVDSMKERWGGIADGSEPLTTLYDGDRWVKEENGLEVADECFAEEEMTYKFTYGPSSAEVIFGAEYDQKYLDHLYKKNPDKFLKELTPNQQHDGQCVGLDLNYAPHRVLQQVYQHDIMTLCHKMGLSSHPAWLEKSMPDLAKKSASSLSPTKRKRDVTPAQTQQASSRQAGTTKSGKEAAHAFTSAYIEALSSMFVKNKRWASENALLRRQLKAICPPRSPWLCIWEGKYQWGGLAHYDIYAQCGHEDDGLFWTRTPSNKVYKAKLGVPSEKDLSPDALYVKTNHLQPSVTALIAEKLALDLYASLGYGAYYVPKNRLAYLPFMNQFTKSNKGVIRSIAALKLGDTPSAGIHLVSRSMPKQRDASEAGFFRDLKPFEIKNMARFRRGKRRRYPKGDFFRLLTDGYVASCVEIDNRIVPLLGLMELMAVSRLLGDTNVLGNKAEDFKFVVEYGQKTTSVKASAGEGEVGDTSSKRGGDYEDKERPLAVRFVKRHAEHAFNFLGKTNQFAQYFIPFSDALRLADAKDLQVGGQEPITIPWKHLLPAQRRRFLTTLKRGYEALKDPALVDFIIRRHGAFDRQIQEVSVGETSQRLSDTMVESFKSAWKRYRDAQLTPQVYGKVLQDLKPVEGDDFSFCPKRVGAMDCQIVDAIKLCVKTEASGACAVPSI